MCQRKFNSFKIAVLFVKGCSYFALSALIAYIIHSIMGRRKRKREDDDTGTPRGKTKVSKRSGRCPYKPKGIPNIGASCFMNSMLQCLSWSPCLRDQLEHQTPSENYKGQLATTLLSLLQLNHEGKNQTESLKSFRKELAKEKDHLDGRSQEDSYEFFNTLISGLEDEALENIPFRPKEEKLTEMEHIMKHCDVTRLFGGMFMTCYCYKACGHIDPVFQRFTSLTIPPVVETQDTTSKPTCTKKRPYPQNNTPSTIKPKKCRRSAQPETKSVSGYVDAPARKESTRQPEHIAKDKSQAVSNASDQATTLKNFDSVPLSRKKGNGNPEREMPKHTCDPAKSSDTESIDMSTLREALDGLDEQGSDTGSRVTNKTENVVSGKDDTNNSDENKAQSGIDQITENEDDQKSLLDGSLDNIYRLQGLCLQKTKTELMEGGTGLELGLEKFTKVEQMMASDLPCRTCNSTEGVLYKQTQLVSLPNVLVVHINRFEQNGRELSKVTDFVSYPKVLDMAKFCSKGLEQLETDDDLIHGQKYSLFGIVNHQGSMRGGHYYAYIKTNNRDEHYIKRQLENSWKDPEAMAATIRSQLEDIWQVEGEICVGADEGNQGGNIKDGHSQNSQVGKVANGNKTGQCRNDRSKNNNVDQGNSVVPDKRPNDELVTFDNMDNKQYKRYDGHKSDLKQQKDHHLQKTEDNIKEGKTEENVSSAGQQEDGTIEQNEHTCRTQMDATPDGNNRRANDAQDEGRDNPDRLDGYEVTDLEEDIGSPICRTEYNRETLEEEKNHVGIEKKVNNTVCEKEINAPGLKKENDVEFRPKDINGSDVKRVKVTNFPDQDMDPHCRSEEEKETFDYESIDGPSGRKEHANITNENATNPNIQRCPDIPVKQNDSPSDVYQDNDEMQRRGKDVHRKEDIDSAKQKREGKKKHHRDDRDDRKRPLQRNEKQDTQHPAENRITDQNRGVTYMKDPQDSDGLKTETPDIWYYVSDSRVTEEKETTVFKSTAAYILLYERM